MRAVLHDQGVWQGHGLGPGVRLRPAVQWPCQNLQRVRGGHDDQALSAPPDRSSEEAAEKAAKGHAPVQGSGETILVVEDEPDLRAYTIEALCDLGYRVLEAADGREALELVAKHSEIRLLFTDVVLRGGMNGRAVAEEVLRHRPELPVLFTTGYTSNAIVHQSCLDPRVHLIGKPFTYGELASKVRRMLDGD